VLFKLLSIEYSFQATRLGCVLIIKLFLEIVVYSKTGAENLLVTSLLARSIQ
jgi:hypothetical protein